MSKQDETQQKQIVPPGQVTPRSPNALDGDDMTVEPPQPRRVYGEWAAHDPRRIFVEGWSAAHFEITGATMFSGERDSVEAEAQRRYDRGDWHGQDVNASPLAQFEAAIAQATALEAQLVKKQKRIDELEDLAWEVQEKLTNPCGFDNLSLKKTICNALGHDWLCKWIYDKSHCNCGGRPSQIKE